MTKNQIIGVVAIVAVIGGGVYYFSSGGSVNPDAGVKNLTRDSAAKAIKAYINSEQNSSMGVDQLTLQNDGNYDTYMDNTELQELSDAGFLKVIKTINYGLAHEIKLSEKATPYVRKAQSSATEKVLVFATADKVEVSGITTPTDSGGQRHSTAEASASMSPTSMGQALSADKLQQYIVNSKLSWVFVQYDDGWRIVD